MYLFYLGRNGNNRDANNYGRVFRRVDLSSDGDTDDARRGNRPGGGVAQIEQWESPVAIDLCRDTDGTSDAANDATNDATRGTKTISGGCGWSK